MVSQLWQLDTRLVRFHLAKTASCSHGGLRLESQSGSYPH
jgi:hypothetical protein